MRTDILTSTTVSAAVPAAERVRSVPVFGPVLAGGCPR